MIREYNAVVLCDLPAQARNQIMKFCYQESIRTYVTPKISDIISAGRTTSICSTRRCCYRAIRDCRSISASLREPAILCCH